ncbi:uncharacterized protein HD556DRAFT_1308717 [Suillus plorans]|uniref:Uncharacterized protein n=1 Tax=Suillus plorans TaxID=116603 RepID=A0A9P7ANY0_9AGAM|nr:uncharacterized protein HD556DRAFT_1308717 [Suillus plorans]KAG1793279.1 hypothetical protein HD556DRAFT_1308717 [Suillus plorans]
MPPGKILNNEPDPPESNSSLTIEGHNTRRNPRRTTSEEIEAMPNKVMDTRGAECYLQEKLLSIRDQPLMLTHLSSVLFHITQMSSGIPLPVITAIQAIAFILKCHTACEIAKAAAKHFTNNISTSLTEQLTMAISLQIEQIQSPTETLKTTIHDTETLRKNMQHERDEKEGDSQTAAERIEEATNILHDSVNECKDTLKTLQPALETTQKHVTHLSTQLLASKQLNAIPVQAPGPAKPTYSSITAANLPPSVDQAMARAATRARQILITPKVGSNIFPDANQHADIVKTIKQALTNASNEETPKGGIKSVQTPHSRAIIIELDTEELATWLRSPAGRYTFEEHLGPAASLRERTFSINDVSAVNPTITLAEAGRVQNSNDNVN